MFDPRIITSLLDKKILDASANGNVTQVLELLANHADVNAVDEDKYTPLHWASYRGHEAVVTLLLKYDADVLAEVEVSKPRIPVVSNVDAKAHSDPAVIKSILTKQVTAPVQWETMMKELVSTGYEAGYELGPGKVLAGIMKRVDKTKAIENIEV